MISATNSFTVPSVIVVTGSCPFSSIVVSSVTCCFCPLRLITFFLVIFFGFFPSINSSITITCSVSLISSSSRSFAYSVCGKRNTVSSVISCGPSIIVVTGSCFFESIIISSVTCCSCPLIISFLEVFFDFSSLIISSVIVTCFLISSSKANLSCGTGSTVSSTISSTGPSVSVVIGSFFSFSVVSSVTCSFCLPRLIILFLVVFFGFIPSITSSVTVICSLVSSTGLMNSTCDIGRIISSMISSIGPSITVVTGICPFSSIVVSSVTCCFFPLRLMIFFLIIFFGFFPSITSSVTVTCFLISSCSKGLTNLECGTGETIFSFRLSIGVLINNCFSSITVISPLFCFTTVFKHRYRMKQRVDAVVPRRYMSILYLLMLYVLYSRQFVLLFRRRHEFRLELSLLFLFLVFPSAYILFLYPLKLPKIPVHFVPLSWKDQLQPSMVFYLF
ncbi:hypothetical protein ALC57_05506 [Trachymyrmex cornetzi]|uniref:Uncharacterized protein n=1 Tax=Trachymyrmex cornetzi TaxID=471704 RepID=A0A151JAK4_9HYME|nr:hypothetical protein ALC57_05506 [Trachymyrmex cornetzi]